MCLTGQAGQLLERSSLGAWSRYLNRLLVVPVHFLSALGMVWEFGSGPVSFQEVDAAMIDALLIDASTIV